MIRLTVLSAKTQFEGPEEELNKLFKSLRVKDKNSYWKARFALKRHAYFSGYEEEERQKKIEELKEYTSYIRFYERRGDTFLTGLLDRAIQGLKKRNVKYEVLDYRKVPPKFQPIKKFRFADKVEDRPEQVTITNEALKKGRGIIHAATNAGKTEIACAIISEFYRQHKRVPKVLFLIHRATLVVQTMERFKKHLPDGIRIEMVGGGEKNVSGKGVIVATVQTASNILLDPTFNNFLEKTDILFIDEFHLNKAWQCTRIVERCQAPMRFGLSGTINANNKVKLLHYIGMCGPIIAEIRNKELVELGRSAKPIIKFHEVIANKIPKSLRFAIGYQEGIVENKSRNNLVVKSTIQYLEKNYKTLVTVARVNHGRILKKLLEQKLDLRIEFLSGSSPLELRNRVIKEFERGKIAVLIASPIFDTGVDIPAIEAWVNAAGGRGWELVLQRLGRVLRKKKGVNKVYVTDFIDKHNVYLMRHSMARLKYYLREKIAEVSIT